jgi:LuxR family maltose regulon positive regulatory protein
MENALRTLRQAYDMSHQNDIISPFVESANDMRILVEHARKNVKYKFDSDWLDSIHKKSAVFAKRLSLLSSEHFRNVTKTEVTEQKLSKRETEVLNNLSQGLTREEISTVNGISVNTVKSVISSIYNKLGAVNRADAVRIATSMGLLK